MNLFSKWVFRLFGWVVVIFVDGVLVGSVLIDLIGGVYFFFSVFLNSVGVLCIGGSVVLCICCLVICSVV